MKKQGFVVEVNIKVMEADIDSDYNLGYIVRGSGLTLSETVSVDATGFMDLCSILGRFKELADSLNTRKKG